MEWRIIMTSGENWPNTNTDTINTIPDSTEYQYIYTLSGPIIMSHRNNYNFHSFKNTMLAIILHRKRPPLPVA